MPLSHALPLSAFQRPLIGQGRCDSDWNGPVCLNSVSFNGLSSAKVGATSRRGERRRGKKHRFNGLSSAKVGATGPELLPSRRLCLVSTASHRPRSVRRGPRHRRRAGRRVSTASHRPRSVRRGIMIFLSSQKTWFQRPLIGQGRCDTLRGSPVGRRGMFQRPLIGQGRCDWAARSTRPIGATVSTASHRPRSVRRLDDLRDANNIQGFNGLSSAKVGATELSRVGCPDPKSVSTASHRPRSVRRARCRHGAARRARFNGLSSAKVGATPAPMRPSAGPVSFQRPLIGQGRCDSPSHKLLLRANLHSPFAYPPHLRAISSGGEPLARGLESPQVLLCQRLARLPTPPPLRAFPKGSRGGRRNAPEGGVRRPARSPLAARASRLLPGDSPSLPSPAEASGTGGACRDSRVGRPRLDAVHVAGDQSPLVLLGRATESIAIEPNEEQLQSARNGILVSSASGAETPWCRTAGRGAGRASHVLDPGLESGCELPATAAA